MSFLPSQDWFDALPGMTGILGQTGVLVAVNRRWSESTLWSSLLGDGWGIGGNLLTALESADGDNADTFLELAVGVRSAGCGRLSSFEKQFAIRDSRTRRWFYCQIGRIESSGDLLMVLSPSRPEAADAEALRILAGHAREGQLILQREKIVFANPAISRLTGFSGPELLRKTQDDLASWVLENDRSAFLLAFHEATLKFGREVQLMFVLQDKGGAPHQMDAAVSTIEFQGQPALQLSVLEQTGPAR